MQCNETFANYSNKDLYQLCPMMLNSTDYVDFQQANNKLVGKKHTNALTQVGFIGIQLLNELSKKVSVAQVLTKFE